MDLAKEEIRIIKVREDLSGRRYGSLIVIKQAEDGTVAGKNVPKWLCKCDCGNFKEILGDSLKRGKTISCGCKKGNKHYKSKNEYDIEDFEYGVLYIKNQVIKFDIEDYETIKEYSWAICKIKKNYSFIRGSKNGKVTILSRLVMNCDEGLQVDHINHDPFDNRKSNLRIVTVSQNNMNKDVRVDNTSGYTGVALSKTPGKYIANIKVNQKRIHLGTFSCIEDAIAARLNAEKKYFKEYSFKNSKNLSNKNNN